MIKLKFLAKYTSGKTNLKRDKLNVFIGELRPNIVKDVLIEDNPPKTYSNALDNALRSETINNT